MKALNPSTGNLEEVYVKALDGMPVGSQVEFTGSTIPTGWEEVNDYSTTEMDTGKKWTDGKTIYRKTFTGQASSSTTDGTVETINTGITNADIIISLDGTLTDTNNTLVQKLGGYLNNINNASFLYYVRSGAKIQFSRGGSYHDGYYYITIEYTKSS